MELHLSCFGTLLAIFGTCDLSPRKRFQTAIPHSTAELAATEVCEAFPEPKRKQAYLATGLIC
jgi:hypothetical protein